MSLSESPESAFFSPLTTDWTIAGLLEWIGADDERCHDERLRVTLDAIDRALRPDGAPAVGGVVMLVRSLAMRVTAEPGVGERALGAFLGVREAAVSAPARAGDLVPA